MSRFSEFISQLNSRKVSSYIFGAIGLLFVIIIVGDQLSSRPTAYSQEIEKQREQKNLQFKNDPQGPVPTDKKAFFEGLNYFPVNEDYRLPAEFLPKAEPETLRLMTTTGEVRQMVDAGKLQFELHGLQHQLIVYRYLDPSNSDFFV
ncbi:MAG: DUF1684 domain-containing protein, partial [Bacteroidota bacterium]